MNSKSEPKCDGCGHQKITDEGFCYMFREAPSRLPCGQHDRFKAQRERNGKLLIKNPFLMKVLIEDAMREVEEERKDS